MANPSPYRDDPARHDLAALEQENASLRRAIVWLVLVAVVLGAVAGWYFGLVCKLTG